MLFKRYTISIGLNDKDTLYPVDTYEHASVEIAGRLAQLGVGCTITKGTGVYEHERGEVVIEETVVISIIDFDDKWQGVAQTFYDKIKRDYNQECIAVMVDKIKSELV